jgi:hypothetical protein
LRDTAGRFVPRRFYGGDVRKSYPAGRGDYTGVVRHIQKPPQNFIPRPNEKIEIRVHYIVGEEDRGEVQASLASGVAYTPEEAEEAIRGRIAQREKGNSGMPIPENTEWEIVGFGMTTWYPAGTQMGGEAGVWQRREF